MRKSKNNKVSDDILYLQSALKEKYNVDFVFTGETSSHNTTGSSSDSVLIEYRFYPITDSDLIITATCGVSSDSRMINTVIPFERHRWFNDDLTECVKEKTIASNYTSPIDISEVSLGSATEIIYNLMLDVQGELKKYNIFSTKYSCDIIIDIYNNGKKIPVNFYALDKDIIRDCLITNIY